jgi:hypothetical protein
VAHYIHPLTDEYNYFIFLPLPGLATSPAKEPPKQAENIQVYGKQTQYVS